MTMAALSSIILVMSLNFTQMKHPLAMGMTLLAQTILICGSAGLSLKSMWFSYILFLIFLGAMLVLFVYVASLASNESFKLSLLTLIASAMIVMPLFVLLLLDAMSIPFKHTLLSSSFSPEFSVNSTEMIIKSIYSACWSDLTAFVILYLLLTLIVVVKITSTFFGPLRLS